MKKKQIISMSWDEMFMRHVYLVARKSKDPRTKIGAVIVQDGVIVSEGFNGFPRGVFDYESRYIDRNVKLSFIVHGESNAILNAVRSGMATKGTILYTQGIPCSECAKSIIQAGISEVVYHDFWPKMEDKWQQSMKLSRLLFKEAKIKLRGFREILHESGYNDGRMVMV